MMNENKSGQVTIFVIIGIIIIAAAVLVYMFFPEISFALGIGPQNPQEYIQTCLEENLKEVIENVSLQGGSSNPENYYLYDDHMIEYLCYTNQYYVPCVVQKPMLKKSVENEIMAGISETASECFADMKKSYERRGYSVSMSSGESEIQLVPDKVIAIFNNEIVLTKGSNSERYESIKVFIDMNLYELVSIATSIMAMESRFGDSETTVYMDYYHDLKVEKKKQSDGTTVYILSERSSVVEDREEPEIKFQFASRSYAWPVGYTGESG